MRVVPPILLFLLLGAAEPGAVVAEAELEWRSGPRDDYETLKILLSPATRSGHLAEGSARAPQYGTVTLADDWRIYLAADFGQGRPMLWLDTNNDGELNDERPVPFRSGEEGFELTLKVVRKKTDRIQVRFHKAPDDDASLLRVTALAHREGDLVLAGRLRRVALYDASGDLRFDRPDKDACFLDIDGDGRLDRSENSPERVFPGEPFSILGAGYVLKRAAGTAGSVQVTSSAEVPTPRPREWKRKELEPPAGRRAPGGHQSLAQIKKRYKTLRKLERNKKASMKTSRTWILKDAGELGTMPAFNFLLECYTREKGDVHLRALAVDAMGYVEYAGRAAKVLEIAGKTSHYQVRAAALRALHGMAADGRTPVMREALLKARSEEVAQAAAMGLIGTGEETARTALRLAAQQLPESACRYHAYIGATRYWREQPPAALVISAGSEEDPRFRALGIRDARNLALPEAYGLALEGAKFATLDESLLHEVALTLGAVGDLAAIEAVLPLASHAKPRTLARLVVLLSLVRDPAELSKLIEAVRDAQAPATRRLAVRALARVPGDAITRALVDQLDRETNKETLQALALAVGRRRATEAIDPLRAVAAKGGVLGRTAIEALAAIGMDNEKVFTFFEARAKEAPWEERVLLLDAAASSRSVLAAPLLIGNLGHKVWQVRLAAVQGLGRVRSVDAVGPLIDRLESGDSKRLERAVAASLYRITGMNFGDDAGLWRNWWKDAEEGFRAPPDGGELRPAGRRTVATFYGLPVDSDRVIFVLDQSGSMSNRRKKQKGESRRHTELQYATEETLRVARRLGNDAKANVICFEGQVHPWKDHLMPMGSRNLGALTRYLRARRPAGATNLFDALEQALGIAEVDTVYLLSDGSPTAGRLTAAEQILDAVREINRTRRIAIHCVSLGNDSELLQRLAEENSGVYVRR